MCFSDEIYEIANQDNLIEDFVEDLTKELRSTFLNGRILSYEETLSKKCTFTENFLETLLEGYRDVKSHKLIP